MVRTWKKNPQNVRSILQQFIYLVIFHCLVIYKYRFYMAVCGNLWEKKQTKPITVTDSQALLTEIGVKNCNKRLDNLYFSVCPFSLHEVVKRKMTYVLLSFCIFSNPNICFKFSKVRRCHGGNLLCFACPNSDELQ